MTTPEPLLSDAEAVTLRALLRMCCDVEIELPPMHLLGTRDAWRNAVAAPIVKAVNAELHEYNQRKLYKGG